MDSGAMAVLSLVRCGNEETHTMWHFSPVPVTELALRAVCLSSGHVEAFFPKTFVKSLARGHFRITLKSPKMASCSLSCLPLGDQGHANPAHLRQAAGASF